MRWMMLAFVASGLSAAQAQAQTVSGSERFDRYWQEDSSTAGALYECHLYAGDLTVGESEQCAGHEASYAASEPDGPDDFYYALLDAIIEGGGEPAIFERLARQFDIAPDEVRFAVDFMLESGRVARACSNAYLGCPWPEDGRLLALWTQAEHSPLAPSLLADLADGSFDLNALRLPQAWGQSPAGAQFLLERYAYTLDFRIFVLATRAQPPTISLLQTVFTRPPGEIRPEDQLTYFDWLAMRGSDQDAAADIGLLVTALRMREALRLGSGYDAVDLYVALTDAARQRLWNLVSTAPQDAAEAQRARQQAFELMVWLAGAFAAQDDRAGAAALLDRADAIGVFTEEDRQVAEAHASLARYPNLRTRIASPGDADTARFLREWLAPQFSPAERYNIFLLGNTDGTLGRPERAGQWSTAGWLWPVIAAPVEIRTLAAGYLNTPETMALSGYIGSEAARRQRRRATGLALDFDLPAFTAIRDARLARSDSPDPASEAREATASRLNVFRERVLPAGFTAQPIRGFAESADLTGAPELPVEDWQVARIEPRGDGWDLIYTSTELDPTGEISAGGYWYVHSESGGCWQSPIYLGLQQFFPYVVLPASTLPLVDGDHLQIAVAVRELDPESITFPPIRLQASREVDGLMIEASFAELLRDQDADGMTDIFEHRIGLDPLNPDTDGDGFQDGVDGLPLTAFDPSRVGQGELGRIMLEQVFGYDAGAIRLPISAPAQGLEEMVATALDGRPDTRAVRSTLIMRSRPDIFAGLMTSDRIIVLDDAALARISSQYGILYPVGMSAVLPNADASQVYVIWSAGWVGGEFYIHRNPAGEYEVEVTSSWIT